MEGINLLCEIENCGKPAEFFGMKGTIKSRCCGEHTNSLLSKKQQIFDIAGYYFISNLHDAAEFEERKTLSEKGRGNLSALEVICDSELTEALQAINNVKKRALRSVEQRFEEIETVVASTCKEIKNQFIELRVNFDHFLNAKENQLSPAAQLASMDLTVVPRFLRFGIADLSDRISAVLSSSWVIATADIHPKLNCLDPNQKEEVIGSALAEASEYAKKGIQNALIHVDSLTGEEESYELAKEQVINELLKFEKTRMEENLKWLQRSWDLSQRHAFSDSTTVSIGQQLANLLFYQLRQISTAEQILRYCYDKVHAENPLAEVAMSLCTDLCGLYYTCANYEQLEALGQWTLQTFEAAGHSAEYYWSILFYLIDSMKIRGKNTEADALFRHWREFRVGSKYGEVLRLFICAVEASYSGNDTDEKRWMLQAWRIANSHFPTSFFTAFIYSYLSTTYSENSRDQLLKQAQAIYEVSAPKSIYEGINLNRMGKRLQARERWTEAENHYRQAQAIYETVAPKSIPAADNLNSLGSMCYLQVRWREAENHFKQALAANEFTAPQSTSVALNYCNLGIVYKAMGQTAQALDYFKKALPISVAKGNEKIRSAAEAYIAELTKSAK